MELKKVIMYTTGVCPHCTRSKVVLDQYGVPKEDIEEIRVDLKPEARIDMERVTGRRSVPQIFINGRHIGGADELVALHHEGKLGEMLGKAGV